MKKTMPPFDQPNWGDESFDYFNWFRFHHFDTLKKYHTLIDKQYENHPLGKAYDIEDLKLLLNYLDELIKLYDWLPNTDGGTKAMDKVIEDRKKIEKLYMNQNINDSNFWFIQEVNLKVFIIYNYMDTMCIAD